MFYPFSRLALFVVSVCGWGWLFFGGWIAARGVLFYDFDPVLMGTGGGIALGGMIVVALTVGAWAQLATARDTAVMRRLMQEGGPRGMASDAPRLRPVATPDGPAQIMPGPPKTARAEPRLKR